MASYCLPRKNVCTSYFKRFQRAFELITYYLPGQNVSAMSHKSPFQTSINRGSPMVLRYGSIPYATYGVVNNLIGKVARLHFEGQAISIHQTVLKVSWMSCAFGTIHRNNILTSERGTYVCL